MAKTLKVKIVTLSKIVNEDNVKKFFTKAVGGSLEIMPYHAPIVTSTEPCITIIEKEDGSKVELFTSKGVINVENNELTFCCDAVESKDEIDLDRAEEAKERAEKRLKDPSNWDVERAKFALVRALTRIDFKEHSN